MNSLLRLFLITVFAYQALGQCYQSMTTCQQNIGINNYACFSSSVGYCLYQQSGCGLSSCPSDQYRSTFCCYTALSCGCTENGLCSDCTETFTVFGIAFVVVVGICCIVACCMVIGPKRRYIPTQSVTSGYQTTAIIPNGVASPIQANFAPGQNPYYPYSAGGIPQPGNYVPPQTYNPLANAGYDTGVQQAKNNTAPFISNATGIPQPGSYVPNQNYYPLANAGYDTGVDQAKINPYPFINKNNTGIPQPGNFVPTQNYNPLANVGYDTGIQQAKNNTSPFITNTIGLPQPGNYVPNQNYGPLADAGYDAGVQEAKNNTYPNNYTKDFQPNTGFLQPNLALQKPDLIAQQPKIGLPQPKIPSFPTGPNTGYDPNTGYPVNTDFIPNNVNGFIPYDVNQAGAITNTNMQKDYTPNAFDNFNPKKF